MKNAADTFRTQNEVVMIRKEKNGDHTCRTYRKSGNKVTATHTVWENESEHGYEWASADRTLTNEEAVSELVRLQNEGFAVEKR